jgi:hypothetical protein
LSLWKSHFSATVSLPVGYESVAGLDMEVY